ncbi:acyl-CoA dehydrogenase family protein [Marivita sp. S6314]|uniref:acyl-CoA dehydrogenase family protein n=1 Tax=Marivita sp. S6314 TaxID=2926406 RepID=UPI001FF633E5|nr:acyl-CoA dehydrogenase family protein [Marivita sp. S6314]MCK0150880.1 acyl-CoA dehydrogenase family protein [Marivita sp. S6314]
MRFEPTETQAMLAHSASRLAKAAQHGDALDHAIHDAGFRAVTVSEKHSGFGGDMADASVILEEFGRGDVCETTVLNAVICAPLLEAAGRADLLDGIIAGTRHVAFALYEPGHGYQTTPEAVRAEGTTLSGSKCAVIGGDDASDFIVTACDEIGAPALFLLSATAPGLTRHSYAMTDARGAADIRFETAVAERLDLDAAAQIRDAADRGALAVASEAQGIMTAALDITIEHLKTRHQFGKPLSKFQVLQARCADMAIALEQARSGLMAALDAPDPASVSAAKVLSDKAALIVGEGAVQLHGAIGITEEHRIGLLFRRLTAGRSMFGDSRYHLT